MVPYKQVRCFVVVVTVRLRWQGADGRMAALAPPSCSPPLERLDLGKHALALILGNDK